MSMESKKANLTDETVEQVAGGTGGATEVGIIAFANGVGCRLEQSWFGPCTTKEAVTDEMRNTLGTGITCSVTFYQQDANGVKTLLSTERITL